MPIGDLLAQITGDPSPTIPNAPLEFPKRKDPEQLQRPVEKMQRTGPTGVDTFRSSIQPRKTTVLDVMKTKITASSRNTPLASPSATSFKNGQPTPPPTNEPSKAPPKKGSYAEIMARASAAQAKSGQVGKIQHKRIEKMPSKREREDSSAKKVQNIQKNLGPNGKFKTTSQGQPVVRNERNGTTQIKRKHTPPVAEKKVKKAALATTGYAGTARPKPEGSKGTSKSSHSASSGRRETGSDRYRNDRYGSSSARYQYVSDEEDEAEEEEEEEPGYASDVSSDMEAAAFEVDEEEELATRIARREDAEALAEENRLKREKEEKRRRLEAMVKAKSRR